MKTAFLLSALLLLLTACGVAGAPKPPTTPPVSVSGEVSMGVSGGL